MYRTGFNKVPLSGYLIEPSATMGFYVRVKTADHILSFLVTDMHAATELVRHLEDTYAVEVEEQKSSE